MKFALLFLLTVGTGTSAFAVQSHPTQIASKARTFVCDGSFGVNSVVLFELVSSINGVRIPAVNKHGTIYGLWNGYGVDYQMGMRPGDITLYLIQNNGMLNFVECSSARK